MCDWCLISASDAKDIGIKINELSEVLFAGRCLCDHCVKDLKFRQGAGY